MSTAPQEQFYWSGGRQVSIRVSKDLRVFRVKDGEFPERTDKILLLMEDVKKLPQSSLYLGRLDPGRSDYIEVHNAIDESQNSVESWPAYVQTNGEMLIVTSKIVIRFKEEVTIERIKQLLSSEQLQIVSEYGISPNTFLIKHQGTPGDITLNIANRLYQLSEVKYCHPDFIIKLPERTIKNPLFPKQWYLDNLGQNGATPGVDINVVAAWEATIGDPGVVIALLDSGVDMKHEAWGNGKFCYPYDFIGEDDDPTPTRNHGTLCCGIIAAVQGDGIGISGVAPQCRIMPLRLSSPTEIDKIVRALKWVEDKGASVASCSWGYDGPWTLPDLVADALDYVAVRGRKGKGIPIFWAAGNGNELVSTDEWASHAKVIAVAACTDKGVRAPYSDYGPEISLCAPSSGGTNKVISTTISGTGDINQNYTERFGGTSAAAPIAAGVAALILSVSPDLTSTEVKSILETTAKKIDLASGNYTSGHSKYYGWGLIDAGRAVEEARKRNQKTLALNTDHSLLGLHGNVQPFSRPPL